MAAFSSEEELARAAVAWLTGYGWEVYQEVQVQRNRGVADLVAVRHGVVWVLECKRSLSLALLEQAGEWVGRAHYVSIVTPRFTRPPRGHQAAATLLRYQGIGWLVAGPARSSRGGPLEPVVEERLKPRVLRTAEVTKLRAALHENQKTWAAAGNAASKRWTPFQRTCEGLRQRAAAEPGVLLTEAVAGVTHHYRSQATALSALRRWIQQGVVTGVHARKVAGRLRLYPDVGWEDERG